MRRVSLNTIQRQEPELRAVELLRVGTGERNFIHYLCSLLQLLEGPPPSTRDAGGGAVTSGGPDHGARAGRDRHGQAAFLEARRRKDDRALDKDEEDYFNEDRYLHELDVSNIGYFLRV